MSEPIHKIIFVSDWDDTLLPSTYLRLQNYTLMTERAQMDITTRQQLEYLDLMNVKLLTLARSFGQVYILTNSEHGWVSLSAKKFLLQTWEVIKNLTIISGRSQFEVIYPENPYQWKYLGFVQILSQSLNNTQISNQISMISLGDDQFERQALFESTRNIKTLHPKSILFVRNPTIEHLTAQHELIIICLNDVINQRQRVDVQLTITPKILQTNN